MAISPLDELIDDLAGQTDEVAYLTLLEEHEMSQESKNRIFAIYLASLDEERMDLDRNILATFIEFGVNIDDINKAYYADSHRANALASACEYRKVDLMRTLLEAGADVNVLTGYDNKDSMMFNFIGGHNADYAGFHDIAYDCVRFVSGVQLLLKYGAKITEEDMRYPRDEYGGKHGAEMLEFLELNM